MSMAGLTAFLAVAHRVRQFTDGPQRARLDWDPRVQGFWHDIAFFDLAQRFDLIEWPDGFIGGFRVGQTNPNTRIIAFPFPAAPDRQAAAAWASWKDEVRDQAKRLLSLRCGALFSGRSARRIPQEAVDTIAGTTAELIVNALLHGHTTPFVGLQRSHTRITVAVCDVGQGFRSSMLVNRWKIQMPKDATHLEAVALAALANSRDFGLRRAVQTVIRRDGWVLTASDDAEVMWTGELWRTATERFDRDASADAQRRFVAALRETHKQRSTAAGHMLERQPGLRGARISFELPLPSMGRLTR